LFHFIFFFSVDDVRRQVWKRGSMGFSFDERGEETGVEYVVNLPTFREI
jgi:hypothetical protein